MFKRLLFIGIAVLFLVTSLGFSALVIWQMHQESKKPTSQSADSQNATGSGCSISEVPASTLPLPKAFKTEPTTQLVKTDIKVGTGQEAASGDCLQVKYSGTLAKSGKKFDENFTRAVLLKFQLGNSSVIPGWDQGLLGMKVGGERRLVIPPTLAYGSQSQAGIPANSTLVFDVVLVKIGK